MSSIKKDQSSSTVQVKTTPKMFAWLAAVTTVLLIIVSQFMPRGDHQILRIVGVVMLLTAAVFIFTPFYLLSKYGHTQTGKTYMQAEEVVQHGLYAFIRHPQYFGYMLLACGFALLAQHWFTVLLAILSMVFFYLQAFQEEIYCLDQYGESYRHYLQRVPRFNLILGIWRVFRGKE